MGGAQGFQCGGEVALQGAYAGEVVGVGAGVEGFSAEGELFGLIE